MRASGYLVAGLADLLDGLLPGVRQLPIQVALPGNVGAGIPATHGHDHVSPLGQLGGQPVGTACAEVDAKLRHHLEHLGVDAVGRLGPGRSGLVPVAGVPMFQWLRMDEITPGTVVCLARNAWTTR